MTNSELIDHELIILVKRIRSGLTNNKELFELVCPDIPAGIRKSLVRIAKSMVKSANIRKDMGYAGNLYVNGETI